MRYGFAGCVLDVDRFELRRGDRVVHVEPQVFAVLRHLVEHADRVVPREELLDEIWGSRFVTESALTSRIKAARRATGDDGATQAVIRTVRGAGFRLVADVAVLDPADPVPTTSSRAHASVPHPRTTVIGRDDDVAAVQAALGGSRLVTIVGPGGVGKTTVAMVVAAAEADRFDDGAYWCDWSVVDDERGAADALADVLGITRQPDLDTRGSLVVGIGRRRLLLVADNCEHVLDHAGDLLDQLVSSCPGLTVLATSRSSLAVPGEALHTLHPLDCRADGEWSTAAQLFLERARASNSDLVLDRRHRDLVESVCERVDGLPLALELTASRLRSASLEEVAEAAERGDITATRGRGRAERHRTMRDTIAWSYQLLTAAEQRLFEQLWVFAGPFATDDVIGVLGQLGEPADGVPALLDALVDHSMVVADLRGARARFRMLESLRRYAQEVVPVGQRRQLRIAHACWAVAEAEQTALLTSGPEEGEAVRRFEERYAEFRSAHGHAVDDGDVDLALRLAVALRDLAVYRLRDEVFTWMETSLGLPGAQDHHLYPMALGCLGQGLANRGELRRARRVAEEALARSGADDERAVWALRTLSNVDLYEGRLEEARAHADREIELALRTGDYAHATYADVTHVLALAYSGRSEEARAVAARQAEWAERSGSPTQLAWAAFCQAETRISEPDAALATLEHALELGRSTGSDFVVGAVTVALGAAHMRLGRHREALDAFDRAIVHWYRRGDWTHQWTTLRNLVGALAELGQHTDAARLLGAASDPRSGARPFGSDDVMLDRHRRRFRAVLGDDRFDRLVRDGRALDREEVVEVARAAIARAQGVRAPAPT